MSNIAIGTSPITGTIYAGKVLKNGHWGANKVDVTREAMKAVAQRMVQEGEHMVFSMKGKKYRMQVVEVVKENDE